VSVNEKEKAETAERQKTLEEEAKQHKNEMVELESAKRKSELELKEQLEDCRMKVK